MKMTDDQKNLMLAAVLCLLILVVWQTFVLGPKQKELEAQRKQAEASDVLKRADGTAKPADVTATAQGRAAVGAPASVTGVATSLDRKAALALSPRVAIDTPALQGSISLKGGRLDDLDLKSYRETVDPKSPSEILLSPLEGPSPYFVEYGWRTTPGSKVSVPDADTLWKQEGGGSLTPKSPVSLAADLGQGLVFHRDIAVDANYMFTITERVENKGALAVTLEPYSRVYRIGVKPPDANSGYRDGLIGSIGQHGIQELGYPAALKDKGSLRFDGAKGGGWLGFNDKYWATVLIPDPKIDYQAALAGEKNPNTKLEVFWAEAVQPPVNLAAGGTVSTTSRLFSGAKQVGLINEYKDKLDILKFDYVVDWGWFYFVAKPIYGLINWLHSYLGNFGLAILAVTVIVKGAFYPLANKSFESMAKMKKLQPQMEEMKARLKDDKAKQQQELMALYAKEKINPLMGCVPLLLQIPIFIALYSVLQMTLDMRHAPFYGWIKDLSAPDPSSLFNLFGLMPWSPPETLLLGHTLGILPIIMGITMWLSMQLNPQSPDPTQQMVMNWMPAIFIYTMSGLASGLIIYMVWSNILSFIQQLVIMRRQGVPVHILQNLGLDKLLGRRKAA